MSIRVIALDIDGTLTNSKKEITPKTKAALKKAQEDGIRLVIASGRPDRGLKQYVEELELDKHHGLCVCFNGARVFDSQTGEVLFNETMQIEQAKNVLEHMKKFKVSPVLYKGDCMYVADQANATVTYKGNELDVVEYEANNCHYRICEVEDLAAIADWEPNKILTAGDPAYLKEYFEEMREPFQDTLNAMFTADFYYEFTPKGIDKAKALDTVLTAMGYQREEMIAFGDSENDESMIKYAGIGVAMANATDELKAVADEITLSNEEDGIAAALAKHL